MKKRNKVIFLFIFLLFGNFQSYAQDKIKGNWKVISVKNLIPGSYYETKEESYDRLKSDSVCLSSEFKIISGKLLATTEDCQTDNCDLSNLKFKKIKILKNSKVEFDPFTKSKKVLKEDLTKIIDQNFSEKWIKVGYTDCPVGYGDFKMRIILINEKQIVLYNYFNAIVLEEIKSL
jgi:hypothetical protein